MSNTAKYVWAALIIAALTHAALLYATPRVLMHVAMERIGMGGENVWHLSDRVTPASRAIVRPAPDFAYSACSYDLSRGPVTIHVAPWRQYWSLSLYAANSDNYYVIDDREARNGADVAIVRAGRAAPEGVDRVAESPSTRGIALIRRLAPEVESYNAAAQVARDDVCVLMTTPAG